MSSGIDVHEAEPFSDRSRGGGLAGGGPAVHGDDFKYGTG